MTSADSRIVAAWTGVTVLPQKSGTHSVPLCSTLEIGCTPTRMVFLVPSGRTCVTVPWPAFVTHAVPSATSTSSGYDSTGAGFPIRRRVEASTRGTS